MSDPCKGKVGYPTLQAAQAAAAAMAAKKAKKGATIVSFLRAYGCGCGKFHFGKTKQIDWSKIPGLEKR